MYPAFSHKKNTCKGNIFKQCTSINEFTCCTATAKYTSDKFLGLGDIYYGVSCTNSGSTNCGVAKVAGYGNGLCLTHQNLHGAYWTDCNVCNKKRDDDSGTMNATELAMAYTNANETVGSQLPDLVSFDGYQFSINYDVPQNVTDAFDDLADADTPYTQIPDELWAYHIGYENPEDDDE